MKKLNLILNIIFGEITFSLYPIEALRGVAAITSQIFESGTFISPLLDMDPELF